MRFADPKCIGLRDSHGRTRTAEGGSKPGEPSRGPELGGVNALPVVGEKSPLHSKPAGPVERELNEGKSPDCCSSYPIRRILLPSDGAELRASG